MLLAVNLKIPLSPPSLPVTPVLISINDPEVKPLPELVILNAVPSVNPVVAIFMPVPVAIDVACKSNTALDGFPVVVVVDKCINDPEYKLEPAAISSALPPLNAFAEMDNIFPVVTESATY